jgi:hypothetical protein
MDLRLRFLLPLLWFLTAVSGPVALAARSPEWQVAETPRFTVFSQLGEKPTREWITEFDQFLGCLNQLLALDERRLSPLTVVLLARDRDFRPYKPLRADGKPAALAGFFYRHTGWSVIGLAEGYNEAETRRTIFHEGVHWFTAAYPLQNPLWIEEGIAEVFSTFRVVDGLAEWGHAIPGHVLALRENRPVPILDLLNAPRDGSVFNDTNRAGLVYAQAWALTHYLLFGRREAGAEAGEGFEAYLAASRTGSRTEAFRRAFGAEPAEMLLQLRRYLDRGSYYVRRLPLAPREAATVALRAAEGAEVTAALVRLALGGGRLDQARALVERAHREHPEHAATWTADALLARALDDPARAMASAERALAAGAASVDLRLLRVSAEAEVLIGRGGIPDDDARRLTNATLRLINQHRLQREPYLILALLVSHLSNPRPSDLPFLELGRELYPAEPLLSLGLASVQRGLGDQAAAERHLAAALADRDLLPAPARAHAEGLAERWQQADLHREIERHLEAERPAEALAILDQLLTQKLEPLQRALLSRERPRLVALEKLQRARVAHTAGRAEEARPLLLALLEDPGLPRMLEKEVRWLLDSLPSTEPTNPEPEPAPAPEPEPEPAPPGNRVPAGAPPDYPLRIVSSTSAAV